ncbi:glycosyl hydrolase [Paenibacillus spiritus]|uniref:Glycosyl hydrolase n=1 Tax=Paenibacillus spiritus TaxID=2496557 RepID=A0A5J5G4Z8_9BACL|nr:glycosyl hydrolase family 18 protein [Paenibacillus spiritus]KAA9002137.1 glycosyl hydrolase [Paenibacillus spiritus]
MNRIRRRRRAARRGRLFRRLAGLVLIATAVYAVIFFVLPSRLHTDPDWKGEKKPIFVQGEPTGYSAAGTGENLLLPLPLLQKIVDPSIRYESGTQSVILTTASDLLYMQAEQTEASLNNKPLQLRLAPEQKGDTTYLPAEPLKMLYGLDLHEDAGTGAVLLMLAGESVPLGQVMGPEGGKSAALRSGPSIRDKVLADMPPGTRLRIWREEGNWLFAQMDNGYSGYIQAEKVKDAGTKTVQAKPPAPTHAERSWTGKKINLTWEAVYDRQAALSSLDGLTGVNVVSPTWFEIVDGHGNVRSKADSAYVEKAQSKGIEVWGLMSNGFEPDITTQALASYENRMNAIVQMLKYAELYHLDGINIDFENVYTEDGGNVTQFMRELKPLAEARNLIVSMDVSPKSGSEMWSRFLDRRALGPLVDFMMVMAYDEHWASSPEAGSVASLPWAQNAVERILEEDGVPADKLVLGIPLYTRIWSETTKDGKNKVSSKAVGMKTVEDILSEKKLTPKFAADAGQNYVEYKEKGVLQRIWIEDNVSLEARVNMARSLNLAGVASWNRNFANRAAWEALSGIHD